MRKRANVQWPAGSQKAVGGRSNVRVSGKEEIRGHRIRVPSTVPSGQDQHPDCPLFPTLKMVLAVALHSCSLVAKCLVPSPAVSHGATQGKMLGCWSGVWSVSGCPLIL